MKLFINDYTEKYDLVSNIITSLIIGDYCFNQSFSDLEIHTYPLLKEIIIGNNSFNRSKKCSIINCEELERVNIGHGCFNYEGEGNTVMRIQFCSNLRDITISCSSFSNYRYCSLYSTYLQEDKQQNFHHLRKSTSEREKVVWWILTAFQVFVYYHLLICLL